MSTLGDQSMKVSVVPALMAVYMAFQFSMKAEQNRSDFSHNGDVAFNEKKLTGRVASPSIEFSSQVHLESISDGRDGY